ncbi:hypothetical protein ACH5RR_025881 [Cinchona calisaya]|uniref:Uncharacterized protein n=1 Tax=Cinchona calisaya TaxID=153742 RepID=A0ABD2Z0X5_9GENT
MELTRNRSLALDVFSTNIGAAIAPHTEIVKAQTPIDRKDKNEARRGRDSTNLNSGAGDGSTFSNMESSGYSLGIHSSSSDIFINGIATTVNKETYFLMPIVVPTT